MGLWVDANQGLILILLFRFNPFNKTTKHGKIMRKNGTGLVLFSIYEMVEFTDKIVHQMLKIFLHIEDIIFFECKIPPAHLHTLFIFLFGLV